LLGYVPNTKNPHQAGYGTLGIGMFTIRIRIVEILTVIAFVVVLGRLFYWQVLAGSQLEAIAEGQYQSTETLPAERGRILAVDGFPLVSNQPAYTVYAYRPDIRKSPSELVSQLAPLLHQPLMEAKATPSSNLTSWTMGNTILELTSKIANQESSWIPLARKVNQNTKDAIGVLKLEGIGFDTSQIRLYPESSMAAQLLGFVGSDGNGQPKGYFGLEGYYDLELTGKPGVIRQDKDVSGLPIMIGEYSTIKSRQGRTLKLHLDRGLQLLVENALISGIDIYNASAGEVMIMDPQNGAVLALASLPSYDPENYRVYPPDTYKIPSIADTYEPGSTFKTVVMAAALDAGVIKPTDVCNQECAGPVTIGQYTIKTWNDEYSPGETITDILERSDNVGMVYIGQRLGETRFVDYIKKFGFGTPTRIDLEGETTSKLRADWGDIDVATGSFGQGIAVSTIQMIAAVSALGNGGYLFQPQVVAEVSDGQKNLSIKPNRVRKVISESAARQITEMMIKSATHGEARWRLPKGYEIAGKTGTAQIPVSGHYDAEKTIASFVGFVPALNPRFSMIVKLREPQSSQWASETAAPLWFDIAAKVIHYLNIPPSN
jgi:cell division protein FtsI/penicillin-binding protein 2